MKKKAFIALFFAGMLAPSCFLHAQELIQDKTETLKAEVVRIEKQEQREVPGTDVETVYQTIDVKILDGLKKGEEVQVTNDYINLKAGEVFYLLHTVRGEDGLDVYAVSEPYRLPVIYFFVILFIVLVVVFGGIQGIRGLLSLIGSFILILYLLLPGILQGYSPILVSIGVSSLIIILGSYITHGFNRTTTSAVLGMIVTVVFTGILAFIAVHFGRFTGFGSEEAVYLNLDTRGAIDFPGLLLGGILIGLLGVLYDIAIGQAISVEELHQIAPTESSKTIYKRALRIGREHIGALVNTLAIAYVGASLPLLLLFYKTGTDSVSIMVNREIFATEIIRIMIGSIGLILAVPITTLISVWILVKLKHGEDFFNGKKEKKSAHVHHHH